MSFFVSQILATVPAQFQTPTQERIYATLTSLGISIQRVDTDDGTTMDDCRYISEGLGASVVKTIFLCNRQQTQFYMYVTSGDKPFVTRDFCGALGISRVSFAPTEMLWQKLGTRLGATTALSLFNDLESAIKLVIDTDITQRELFACTDGTTTCFLKMPMQDFLNKYLPSIHHDYMTI